jgi:hypothetical protein
MVARGQAESAATAAEALETLQNYLPAVRSGGNPLDEFRRAGLETLPLLHW